jgi:lipopolysaccharide export system permease protein
MYILTRYVVWEVLKFFVAALAALTILFTLVIGIQKGLQLGLPPVVMLRIMPFMLPEMLGITIPVAMLFAVSSVFGRMTGANEIVAIKSLGISPMTLIWPIVVFASFLSLGTVYMYELAATWCKPNVMRIFFESTEEVAYSMLQANHSYCGPRDAPQLSIIVKQVDQRSLVQPTITIFGPPRAVLRADRAELATDLQAREPQLKITCYNAEIEVEGLGSLCSAEPISRSVPIVVPERPPYHRDWMAMREIPKSVDELQTRLRQLESLRGAQKALGDAPSDDEAIKRCRENIYRLQAEPYRRWSNGFTCLCFAMVGIPVAMFWRYAEVLTNFFICFLPILAVYYPLLLFSENLATSGKWPPIIFWMGNAVLLAASIVLLRRIIRH